MRRSPLAVQRAVLHALIVRELRTRFGAYRLGYLWALLEPIAHIVLLTFIFSARGRGDIAGVELPVFMIAGIVPFLLFRNSVTRAMSAVESNSGLFNYRQVKPLDAAVARLVLEAVIHLLALAVLLLGAVYLGYAVPVHDPLAALGALGLLAGLGAGLGLIACVVACRFEESKKIIPVLMRPLYFLSGIFFPLDAIPTQFQPYLLWNPILHGIELFRGSIVVVDAEIHGDFTYLGIAALVVIYAGLALFRRDRFEMVAS